MRIKTDDGTIDPGVRPLWLFGKGGIVTSTDPEFPEYTIHIDGSGLGVHDAVVVIDGIGSAITTGVKGDLAIDFDCEITQWTLLADQSGSIEVDVWKDTFANYPPTVADSITGSDVPTLSATDHNRSTALTGWTKTITAGDTLRFNVASASTVTRVTLVLKLQQ